MICTEHPRAAIPARMRMAAAALPVLVWLILGATAPASAGVTNPDISVIGQPFIRSTDDRSDPDHGRMRLDPGETEFDFNAALNPYANGVFVMSLSPHEGVDLEEGYFTLVRGLPAGLALKGGKYRVGFGRLNQAHPHAYPFSERPRVLAAYLPGEESFNETGISLSRLFPIVGDFSVTASADWLQGDSFHPAASADSAGASSQVQTRPAFLGRLSGFTMLGDQSALEFGVSGTHGTHDVAARLGTTVLGVDAKAKLWTSPRAYVVLQAEGLRMNRQEPDPAGCAECGPSAEEVNYGGYAFADYNFALRYNVGASYERFQQHAPGKPVAQAVGLFAGLGLLEETTAFRADWNRFDPQDGPVVNRFTLRVIYSMGPHKAHQF